MPGAVEEAADRIYRFDPEMARLGVRYFAEHLGWISRTTRPTIYVHAEQANVVAAVAARLRKRKATAPNTATLLAALNTNDLDGLLSSVGLSSRV